MKIGPSRTIEIIPAMTPPSVQNYRASSSLREVVTVVGLFSFVEVSKCAGEGVHMSFV